MTTSGLQAHISLLAANINVNNIKTLQCMWHLNSFLLYTSQLMVRTVTAVKSSFLPLPFKLRALCWGFLSDRLSCCCQRLSSQIPLLRFHSISHSSCVSACCVLMLVWSSSPMVSRWSWCSLRPGWVAIQLWIDGGREDMHVRDLQACYWSDHLIADFVVVHSCQKGQWECCSATSGALAQIGQSCFKKVA